MLNRDDLTLVGSAFDHMRFLGNTLEDICEKKSGIFKKDTPALIGPNVPFSVASVSFHEFVYYRLYLKLDGLGRELHKKITPYYMNLVPPSMSFTASCQNQV